MKDNKCKNCGNKVSFNPDKYCLSCDYCGSDFPLEKNQSLINKRPYDEYVTFDEVNKSQYVCESCGSYLNKVDEQSIKRCPNCGSLNLKLTSHITYMPDGIIPFKISKQRAKVSFYEWIKKRKFAPKDLKAMAKVGKLSGFYTPVWNFDGTTFTTYSGYGVNTNKDKDGKAHETRTRISGTYSNSYFNVIFSGNKNVSASTLKQLGNWGLESLKVYSLDYLCGFLGTDVNIDIHHSFRSFVSYASSKDKSNIRAKYIGRFDRVEHLNCFTNINAPKFNYIYLPLWANYYTYKNKNYQYYINGSSGKVFGKSPKSFWKVFLLCLGIGLAVATITIIAYNMATKSVNSAIDAFLPFFN